MLKGISADRGYTVLQSNAAWRRTNAGCSLSAGALPAPPLPSALITRQWACQGLYRRRAEPINRFDRVFAEDIPSRYLAEAPTSRLQKGARWATPTKNLRRVLLDHLGLPGVLSAQPRNRRASDVCGVILPAPRVLAGRVVPIVRHLG
jgi:hypothetical protein